MPKSATSAGPNDPCICSSGLKYKRCCGTPEAIQARRRRDRNRAIGRFGIAVIAFATVIGAVYGVMSLREPRTVPPPVIERPALTPQPPGPVPEGKVWSPEHGHWHDLP